MPHASASFVIEFLRGLTDSGRFRHASDFELLQRFLSARDEDAFRAIVRRHGAMVLSVCRSAAGVDQDAEDAFQATFLVLAQKADAIRKADSLASWLFGVAYRAGMKAKRAAQRRRLHESALDHDRTATSPSPPATDELSWREAQSVIHQEVNALGERERVPLVLCCLEGLTQDQASQALGWSRSTFKRRFDRARAILRRRLLRRGLGPVSLVAASTLAASRPSSALAGATAQAAVKTAKFRGLPDGIVSVSATNLTRCLMKTYLLTKLKILAAISAVALASLMGGYAVVSAMPDEPRQQPIEARVVDADPGGGEKDPGNKKEEKPSVHSPHGARSVNNLKQIGIAMHLYHDTFGGLPPPAITDKDGKPLLSWRVAILPYLEEDQLYREFKLDEPWDSEHNKKLIARMPVPFVVPGINLKKPGLCHYQVFVGKGSAFEPKGQGANIRLKEITDGTANTIMVVETEQPVIWTKPDDLPFDPKGALPKLGIYADGFNAAFCDGSVHTLPRDVAAATLRALITRNGGEVVVIPPAPMPK